MSQSLSMSCTVSAAGRVPCDCNCSWLARRWFSALTASRADCTFLSSLDVLPPTELAPRPPAREGRAPFPLAAFAASKMRLGARRPQPRHTVRLAQLPLPQPQNQCGFLGPEGSWPPRSAADVMVARGKESALPLPCPTQTPARGAKRGPAHTLFFLSGVWQSACEGDTYKRLHRIEKA